MPAAFVSSALVRRRDDDESTDLRVVVEERDLPSRERQQAGPTVLGQVIADREGRFQLGFEAPEGPDLSFIVLDRDGRRLVVQEVAAGNHQGRGDEILFNAVNPFDVTLTVVRGDRPVAASEYHALLTQIGLDISGPAPADLAEDELDVLVWDLGRNAGDDVAEIWQRLAYLGAADLLSRSTRLIGAPFYGWAWLGVAELWTKLPSFEDPRRQNGLLSRLLDELAGTDAGQLADELRRAAEARIIPIDVADRADAPAHAVRRRALTPVSVRLHLVGDPGGQPLAAYTVDAFDGSRRFRNRNALQLRH